MAVLAMVVVSIAFIACEEETGKSNRQQAVEHRDSVFTKAKSRYPDPSPSNFPLREALVKFTNRQDELNHPWYIYIVGDNGNTVNYHVGQTVPINACNFLSSTESVRDDDSGNLLLTAPSLDGIFYGGSNASGACDAWFFFDAATDALIQIRGMKFYTADRPLLLDVEPVLVAPE